MSTSVDDAAGHALPFTLAEPVRQRLVQVAAEVLGRLPADQVPSSLKAIARFTPAKRHRLGGVAIAGALDTDDDFRESVAAAVSEVAAAVVAAGDEQAGLHASDPIDIAVIAFLTRPERWQETVADATERWSAAHAPAQAADEEIVRLRAELAEVRGQARAAQARAKQAEALIAEQRDAETDAAQIARLTRDLRVRTGELRTAQRERDDALAAVDAAVAAATATATAASAQLQAAQLRVEELERASEASRRAVRTEREFDDVRLRMLLETLTDAAAGIRRELALPATTRRPADAVDAGEPVGSGSVRGATDAASLERLLALPQVHLIVDGYNVTKTGYGDMPLADQRARLVVALAALHSRAGAETTVVFDGAARPAASVRTPRGVRVLFSAEGEIADDLIRRLVAAEPAGRPLVVVTSDQAIVTDVRAGGAWTAPAGVLLALLG